MTNMTVKVRMSCIRRHLVKMHQVAGVPKLREALDEQAAYLERLQCPTERLQEACDLALAEHGNRWGAPAAALVLKHARALAREGQPEQPTFEAQSFHEADIEEMLDGFVNPNLPPDLLEIAEIFYVPAQHVGAHLADGGGIWASRAVEYAMLAKDAAVRARLAQKRAQKPTSRASGTSESTTSCSASSSREEMASSGSCASALDAARVDHG